MRRLELKGGVAVVTGAASGIGKRLAVRLGQLGCSLALVDVNEAALSTLRTELRRPGVDVTVHAIDVGQKHEVLKLPMHVVEAHGGVTLLVNNAGIALGGRFDQLLLDDIERLIEVNLLGIIRMTHAFLPVLQRQPAAHIVNLSSLFGIIAPPGQTAYAAAKFGVRGFSESLRHELRGTPVGVTVVHPGGIRTNISNNMVVSAALTEEETDDMRRLHARLLTLDPDEAARQILDAAVQRRRRLLIGRDAKRAVAMQRLFPVSYWTVAELINPRMRERRRRSVAQARVERHALVTS